MKHIKEFEEFINEEIHYYGVDSDTEKKAGLPSQSYSQYANADAFKRDIGKYFFNN